jgi:hypothetical protein
VRWLGKTYGKYFGTQGPKNLENTDAEDSDDEGYIILNPDKVPEAEQEAKMEVSGMITRSKALLDNLGRSIFGFRG